MTGDAVEREGRWKPSAEWAEATILDPHAETSEVREAGRFLLALTPRARDEMYAANLKVARDCNDDLKAALEVAQAQVEKGVVLASAAVAVLDVLPGKVSGLKWKLLQDACDAFRSALSEQTKGADQ